MRRGICTYRPPCSVATVMRHHLQTMQEDDHVELDRLAYRLQGERYNSSQALGWRATAEVGRRGATSASSGVHMHSAGSSGVHRRSAHPQLYHMHAQLPRGQC
eukprot:352272-Chlamydomonas_euryale.AAC.3